MFKKKNLKKLESKRGRFFLISLTFLSLFILQVNNVGLSLREGISVNPSLDFSWFLDSIERMLHGYILGRDFTFTYGPIFQLIYALPSLFFQIPSYISFALSPLVSFIFVFILVLI